MNGFGHASRTHATARATVHEARVAMMAVDRALHDGRLAGPADAYHVMGSLVLMTRTLQRSLNELATWLRDEQEEHHRRFTVVDGPFVDDPKGAVTVAAQSLVQASAACTEVFNALERAHIAMAHVGSEQGPTKGTVVRRTLRRRRWA